MQPRTLLNIALLLALGVMIAIAVFEPGIEEPETPAAITKINPEEIFGIRIERDNGDDLVFTRTKDSWMLTSRETPLPAASYQVQSVLGILGATSRRRYDADHLELKRLGLESPEIQIIFDNGPVISVGSREPLQGYRYLLVDNTVHLVDDRYQYLLGSDWTAFVDRRLIPHESSILQLQLQNFSVSRTGEGGWRVDPQKDSLSSESVEALLADWMRASAVSISSYEPADQQGPRSIIEIVVASRDSPLVLDILSREPELLLGRRDWGIKYHIDSSMAERLLEPQSAAGGNQPPEPE